MRKLHSTHDVLELPAKEWHMTFHWGLAMNKGNLKENWLPQERPAVLMNSIGFSWGDNERTLRWMNGK